MRRGSIILIFVLLLCAKVFTQITDDNSYYCNFSSEEIAIDGMGNENIWKTSEWTSLFVDIEGVHKEKPFLSTRVKMIYDSSYFYFFAEMEEPHIWATLPNRDDIIYYDDDIEIFMDPDGDGHNYYELEFNAFNTLWDLLLLRPYRADNKPKVLFEWNITDIKSAVFINGTINDGTDIDKGWSIEVAIPWKSLKEMVKMESVPSEGDIWRINFSRVDWDVTWQDSIYVKNTDAAGKILPEKNWVWEPTGAINMHMPEKWGYVIFGNKHDHLPSVHDRISENVKSLLWDYYHDLKKHYRLHKKYPKYIYELERDSTTPPAIRLSYYPNPNGYVLHASHENAGISITMREDGLLKVLE